MPLDVDPAITAAVITAAATFVGGLLVALYGPRVSERAKNNKLRNGLYRELINWYESILWYIKYYDQRSEARLFTPSSFRVSQDAPSSSLRPITGCSILRSEAEPHIGRPGRRDLQFKLEKLHEMFARLKKELLVSNLYLQTLQNQDLLQRLYHIKDSFPICIAFEDFRYAFDYEFEPYDSVPHSRFLTLDEAKELSLLEERLDWLKIACVSFEVAEDARDLDACLLDRMRRGKPRGTLVYTTGEPPETARWCNYCKTYSKPIKWRYIQWLMAFPVTHDFYYMFLRKTRYSSTRLRGWFISIVNSFFAQDVGHWLFLREHCEYCRRKLPTLDELSEQLCQGKNCEERKKAAEVLAKIYRFNTVEFKKAVHTEPLILALQDEAAEVREAATTALMHIAKHKFQDKPSEAELELVAQALMDILKNTGEGSTVRKAAIKAVGEIYKNKSAGKALEPLVQALNDIDEEVREAAATAARSIGDERLYFHLCNSLRFTKNPSAQAELVRALGRFGRESISLLTEVLNDKCMATRARRQAAVSMGNVGYVQEVWQPLTEIVADLSSNICLRDDARQALTWLKPQFQQRVWLRPQDNVT
jgi:HEAT repeat protein